MNLGARIRQRRKQAGLTQAELASLAGISRQSISAMESGTNLPRVDVAIAVARALNVPVTDLYGPDDVAVDVVTGKAPTNGAVRLGRVGSQLVTTPLNFEPSGYADADAIAGDGHLEVLSDLAPGLVVAGCEPGLAIVERALRERGLGAIWVATSTTSAISALDAGRTHAAVVHGKKQQLDQLARDRQINRTHLARWQVGLTAGKNSKPGWHSKALAGIGAIVQREDGASIQQVLVSSLAPAAGSVPGPIAGGHIEAARIGRWAGIPALTFEPAAIVIGSQFHALATHSVEIWTRVESDDHRILGEALNVISDRRFARRLESIGGYDLKNIGTRVA